MPHGCYGGLVLYVLGPIGVLVEGIVALKSRLVTYSMSFAKFVLIDTCC